MQFLLVWTKLYRTFALLKFRGVFLCFVLCFIAGVAQWPEQLICNQLAGGSNPSTGSPIKYPVHSICYRVFWGYAGVGEPGQTVTLLS